ncbi:multiple sugar transport system permease protein [Gracilibacillus halotolerans]|uniref:Multiple sugar transport system permease protein n=1 Tax=Gracilibacillus halotolerans TaxID=74386 RepID=A0A841RN10_9BACI|nr:carbohydrate ABC transporter permease [Gracilibacillus halotolerans]MBB6512826.1 multiple sugar transport system permease protein [Gracilibacillus halotolerans]
MSKKSFANKCFTLYLPLGLILTFLIFPFYWTFVTSIKPEHELYGATVTYWPKDLTFASYQKLFGEFNFLLPMFNSLLVATITTVVTLTVSTSAAYAFTRFDFKGKRIFMSLFLTNNMFPNVLLLIPLFAIMRSVNLLYTPLSLVVAYATFTIPFSVWMLTGYLKDLPNSLEEAAMIDGANRVKAFFNVVLPVLMPSIIATGVYIFIQSWNEYTFAVLFTNEATRTIPVTLNNLIGQLGVQWDLLTAGGIITIIPVCVLFFFAQKQLIEGLTAGSVKG